ncbi:unnamed protein product [Nippostrongylus brasiliensis]|uniref:PUB domain-containing protein n=1 Tax=Nippostrongylus brasiliensis TaxID=27835 RepID=A0A0N4YA14_NIPBR|nr:unnamed protein product [Nippostrongylus brasiliensis]
MQGINALLIEPWDPKKDKDVAQRLGSALACLVLAAEETLPTKNDTNAREALKLFDEETQQPDAAKKALALADTVLSRIVTSSGGVFTMPPKLPVLGRS